MEKKMENNNYVLEEDINLGTVKIADGCFFFAELQPEARDVQSAGEALHAALHGVLCLAHGLVHGGDHQILQHLHILGVHGLRLDGDGEDLLSFWNTPI